MEDECFGLPERDEEQNNEMNLLGFRKETKSKRDECFGFPERDEEQTRCFRKNTKKNEKK